MSDAIETLLAEIRACRICAESLPLGPRPIVQLGAGARIVIIGQAPGTKVHESGVPWDDASGDHLRHWLNVDRETFYDPERIALLPMGFCYPGRRGGGDAPPRPECAPTWHRRALEAMPDLELVVLTGLHASRHYLGSRHRATLTATVEAWRDYLPRHFVLPHPSWRSKIWIRKHPFFVEELLPELRKRVAGILGGRSRSDLHGGGAARLG